MSNKFASALKPVAKPVEVVKEKATSTAPSRQSAKHVGGYFDPEVSRQLRTIAASEDTTVQALLGEALDMLFHSRKQPMIASKAKKA